MLDFMIFLDMRRSMNTLRSINALVAHLRADWRSICVGTSVSTPDRSRSPALIASTDAIIWWVKSFFCANCARMRHRARPLRALCTLYRRRLRILRTILIPMFIRVYTRNVRICIRMWHIDDDIDVRILAVKFNVAHRVLAYAATRSFKCWTLLSLPILYNLWLHNKYYANTL